MKKHFYVITLTTAIILLLFSLSGCASKSKYHKENYHAFNLYQIKDNTEVFLSPIYIDDKDRDKIELLSKITNESDRYTIQLEQPDYIIVQMNNDDSTIEDRDSFALMIWLKDGIVYSEIETDMIDCKKNISKSQVTEKEFVDTFLND